MTFGIGSLVSARGREWVVLPDSSEAVLHLQPLGGTEAERTAILLALEPVATASFSLPDPTQVGDFRSARLLREAARLGFRASSGPFRSFGHIAVEPRPYQLVPLLMALRVDPVRMLIADDVGIGKTIEAALIARELLDRGEAQGMVVLCPPHLAEQWQQELADKFHIDAEVVLPSTVRRLEGQCHMGQSLFERFRYLVVSIDFIKADRRRHDFIRACPNLVLVDEAHSCAWGDEQGKGRHQRHEVVRALADDEARHLILVTATPHSGKEDAFRSLLTLMKPEFTNLPHDLTGKQNETHRRNLAQYFVQRRRADIRHYLQAETPFPDREEAELAYQLSPEYRKLFDQVLKFAQETVQEAEADKRRQRVRWWSALSLLRALASSPGAGAGTLSNHPPGLEADSPENVDDVARRTVMDLLDEEGESDQDAAPGADLGEADEATKQVRRRLQDMARTAEGLTGKKDNKLMTFIHGDAQGRNSLKRLLEDGYNPIIFCRFIPTAEYLAEALRKELGSNIEIAAVTGTLPPAEREERVEELGKAKQRILVATDCLSEGINLQENFDAVLHYDLSWNPTRHEQREGRVDRYGQARSKVRVLTYYGIDNHIDGIVLDVLLRKHRAIRSALGISVPIPADSGQVMEAIFKGLLLRGGTGGVQYNLPGFDPVREQLFKDWENVSEREKRSRTLFAQETIKAEEVARELEAVHSAIGRGTDVRWFVHEALHSYKGVIQGDDPISVDLSEVPRAVRDRLPVDGQFKARFELPVKDRQLHLNRTHPVVENLATYVLDSAVDAHGEGRRRRCGVIRTQGVTTRTTLLLVRMRFSLMSGRGQERHETLAEACHLLAFEGAPDQARWLDAGAAEKLLNLKPSGNVDAEQATTFIKRVVDGFEYLRPAVNDAARTQADAVREAHERVRHAGRLRGGRTEVEPYLPVDVLGIYIYLPEAN
jgi:superfamily II DNA or RNA helicase